MSRSRSARNTSPFQVPMIVTPWFLYCVIGILLTASGTGRHSGDRFCSCGFTLSFLRVPLHKHNRFLANALLRELDLFPLSATVSTERVRHRGLLVYVTGVRGVARHTEGLVPRGADGDQRCSDSLKGDPSSWVRGKSFMTNSGAPHPRAAIPIGFYRSPIP